MARAQRVSFPDKPDTYTVVGADGLPIGPAAEYLRFLRDGGASPHTVRAYAAGLAEWSTVLEHTGRAWDDFPTNLFGQFLRYLRTGDLPETPRIGAPQQRLVASSLQSRAAAVLSMYRCHADAHNADVAYRRLFTSRGSWRRYRRYVGFLDGVGPQRNGDHPIYRLRATNKSTTPVLTPPQVNTILDACSIQRDGDWTGGPAAVRNRLLFAVLAETGMRLGEALSLRHPDFISAPGRLRSSTSSTARTIHTGCGSKPARGGFTSAMTWKPCIRSTCGSWLRWAPISLCRICPRTSCSSTSGRGRGFRRCVLKPFMTRCGRSSGLSPICRRSGPRTGYVTPIPPRCYWPGCPSMW